MSDSGLGQLQQPAAVDEDATTIRAGSRVVADMNPRQNHRFVAYQDAGAVGRGAFFHSQIVKSDGRSGIGESGVENADKIVATDGEEFRSGTRDLKWVVD